MKSCIKSLLYIPSCQELSPSIGKLLLLRYRSLYVKNRRKTTPKKRHSWESPNLRYDLGVVVRVLSLVLMSHNRAVLILSPLYFFFDYHSTESTFTMEDDREMRGDEPMAPEAGDRCGFFSDWVRTSLDLGLDWVG